MRPNLTYINDRRISEQVETAPRNARNSIRIWLVDPMDRLRGMQWQGTATRPRLWGLHRQRVCGRCCWRRREDMHRLISAASRFLTTEAEIAVSSARGREIGPDVLMQPAANLWPEHRFD